MGSFLHDFSNSMDDDDDFRAERNGTFYAIKLFKKSVFNISLLDYIYQSILLGFEEKRRRKHHHKVPAKTQNYQVCVVFLCMIPNAHSFST